MSSNLAHINYEVITNRTLCDANINYGDIGNTRRTPTDYEESGDNYTATNMVPPPSGAY